MPRYLVTVVETRRGRAIFEAPTFKEALRLAQQAADRMADSSCVEDITRFSWASRFRYEVDGLREVDLDCPIPGQSNPKENV